MDNEGLTPEEEAMCQNLADDIFGPAPEKKRGWPKGKPRKPAAESEGIKEMSKEVTKEIAPAQMPTDPMEIKVPDAVRNACTARMEELERKMQDINAKIEDLKHINKSYENEYKVLADFNFKKGK